MSRSQGHWPAHSAWYSPPTLLPFRARWFPFWRAMLHAVTDWTASSTQPQLWQRCLQTLPKDPWRGMITLGLRTTALKGGCGWEHGRADRCFHQGGESPGATATEPWFPPAWGLCIGGQFGISQLCQSHRRFPGKGLFPGLPTQSSTQLNFCCVLVGTEVCDLDTPFLPLILNKGKQRSPPNQRDQTVKP